MSEFVKKLWDKEGNVKLLYTNVAVKEHLNSGYYFNECPAVEESPKLAKAIEDSAKVVVERKRTKPKKREVAKETPKENSLGIVGNG